MLLSAWEVKEGLLEEVSFEPPVKSENKAMGVRSYRLGGERCV